MRIFATAIMADEELIVALALADRDDSDDKLPMINAVRARLECVDLDRIAAMLAATFATEDTEDDWCYNLCMAELMQRPMFETVTACGEWARDADPAWRTSAADVIARLAGSVADANASPTVAAMRRIVDALLEDSDGGVVGEAVNAFGQLCQTPRTPEEDARLLHFAQSDSETVRWGVLCAVASALEPADIPMLILFTADPVARIRDWATFSLGTLATLDTPEIRAALMARLDDEDEDTRCEAMRGLAQRQDRRALPAIAGALRVWDDEINMLAVEAAGLMPDKSLLAPLKTLLKDFPGDEDILAAIEACKTGVPSPRWSLAARAARSGG